jgi:hypothetical protein
MTKRCNAPYELEPIKRCRYGHRRININGKDNGAMYCRCEGNCFKCRAGPLLMHPKEPNKDKESSQ